MTTLCPYNILQHARHGLQILAIGLLSISLSSLALAQTSPANANDIASDNTNTSKTTVYKRVLPDGSIQFSDQPSADTQAIELKNIATVPAFKAVPSRPSGNTQANEAAFYQSLTILAPESGTAFWSGDGSVAIEVQVQPALQRRHQIEIKLDGQILSRARATKASATGVSRGSHTLTVNLLNAKGKVLKSKQSTFTVHRPIVKRSLAP